MRSRTPELNWIAHEDLENLCHLAGLEIIRRDVKLLCPIPDSFLGKFLKSLCRAAPLFPAFHDAEYRDRTSC